MTRAWLFSLTLIAGFSFPSVAAERYAAMFTDGSRAEEAEVRDWFEPTSQPKIGGRNLLDDQSPVRWLLDRTQQPAASPPKYIEIAGGDRIAGEVTVFSEGNENPYETRLPHLVVKPAIEILPPEVNSANEIRVATEWLQRIVWDHVGSDDYRPGTVWMKSGSSLTFRTLRWKSSGVMLLTTEGLKEVSFSDLGEVHFPRLDSWTAYFEQLSILSPDAKSRLIQFECHDGSRCTTSMERFQARHTGDRNKPEHWYQLIQPAWCLDPVWLRYRTIRSWRFFVPNEIPLSTFALVQAQFRPVFGRGWDWQTDRNAKNGPLRSRDLDFGWGFGVFGTSELTFEFPEIATQVRTGYGLDRSVGTGGCVSMEIVDGAGRTLAKQENLIGSEFVGRIDHLALPPGKPELRRLTFKTEMAHESRPSGADPLDVRDFFNWYEPEVQLDQSALEAEVRSRASQRLGGLVGWSISAGDHRSLRVSNLIDDFDAKDPRFRRVIKSTDRFYTLTRKVQFGPRDRWMAIVASRFTDKATASLAQVRIDGRVFAEFELPIRNSINDPEPMLVSVESFQGRSARVEVIVYPKDEMSWVDWRGFSIGPDRPGLRTIFEDDLDLLAELDRGAGRIDVDTESPYSGKASLKLTPGAGSNPRIPGLEAQICDSPRLGQFRYLVFAWKKATGSRIQVQLANQGLMGEDTDFPPADRLVAFHQQGLRRSQNLDERGQRYRYCYEKGQATTNPPAPLWLNADLPRNWQPVQRDLFGDFGNFSLTGLSLKCVDGDACWFDHFYLARSHEDLQFVSNYLVNPQPVPPKPDGSGQLWIHGREDYATEISRIAPLFSTMEATHGLARFLEKNGQTDVLRTHPNDRDRPLILHAGVELPKDRPMMLDLHVSHDPGRDWRLVVKANGEVLVSELINEKLTTPQRGWATTQVDLSQFTGQKVLLEVLDESNDWNNETSYWKRIELVDK